MLLLLTGEERKEKFKAALAAAESAESQEEAELMLLVSACILDSLCRN